MTYNTHRCTGTDGLAAPERTAKIISAVKPDVVALQELDVQRSRTHRIHQPKSLSKILQMDYFFYPRLTLGKEQYGLALFSRFPMHLMKAADLPSHKSGPEATAAIWAQIKSKETTVNVVCTHFKHSLSERLLQTKELLGENWLGHPDMKGPLIFCGDLNSTTFSPVYHQVKRRLHDAQRESLEPHQRILNTWPSTFPLFRIDHIFVSKECRVLRVSTVFNTLTRAASDHLPLIADIALS